MDIIKMNNQNNNNSNPIIDDGPRSKAKFLDDFMYHSWLDTYGIPVGLIPQKWITDLEEGITIDLLNDMVNGFAVLETTIGMEGPYLTTEKPLIKGIQNNLFAYFRFSGQTFSEDTFVFYAVGFADDTTKYYTGNLAGFWIAYSPQLWPFATYCFISQTLTGLFIYDTGIANDDELHEWTMVSNNSKLKVNHYNKVTNVFDEVLEIDVSEIANTTFMKPAIYCGYQAELEEIYASMIVDVYYFEADRIHDGVN